MVCIKKISAVRAADDIGIKNLEIIVEKYIGIGIFFYTTLQVFNKKCRMKHFGV